MFVAGIDPGHGGRNTGTCSLGTMPEKQYNLETARDLVKVLDAHGIASKLSRKGDDAVSFGSRAERLIMCPFTLVLHVNAANSSARHGLECYYRGGDNLALSIAEVILHHRHTLLHKRTSLFDVSTGGIGNWLERPENTIERYDRSALLVELFYGSNQIDREFGLSEWGRRSIVNTLAAGIIRAGEYTKRGIAA